MPSTYVCIAQGFPNNNIHRETIKRFVQITDHIGNHQLILDQHLVTFQGELDISQHQSIASLKKDNLILVDRLLNKLGYLFNPNSDLFSEISQDAIGNTGYI